MRLVELPNKLDTRSRQMLKVQGVNVTDNYADGQMASSKNITSNKFPRIGTSDQMVKIDTGIADGYQPVSMYAWEKLFVVSDEPGNDGYKCYYGGEYCGDMPTLDIPKQYAVINSKLVVYPDKVYFDLYDNEMSAIPLDSAPLLGTVPSGTVTYRKAVTE